MTGLRVHTLLCILLLAGLLPNPLVARPENCDSKAHALLFVEVDLNNPVKFSSLKKGDVLRGEAVRNVFSGYHLTIPAGS